MNGNKEKIPNRSYKVLCELVEELVSVCDQLYFFTDEKSRITAKKYEFRIDSPQDRADAIIELLFGTMPTGDKKDLRKRTFDGDYRRVTLKMIEDMEKNPDLTLADAVEKYELEIPSHTAEPDIEYRRKKLRKELRKTQQWLKTDADKWQRDFWQRIVAQQDEISANAAAIEEDETVYQLRLLQKWLVKYKGQLINLFKFI